MGWIMIDGAYDVRSQTKPNNEQHNICIWNTSERRAESWNGEVVYISWVESIKANPLCNHKEKQSRNRIECYNTQSHTHNFFGEKNDINSRKNGFSVNELYALSRLFLSISRARAYRHLNFKRKQNVPNRKNYFYRSFISITSATMAWV